MKRAGLSWVLLASAGCAGARETVALQGPVAASAVCIANVSPETPASVVDPEVTRSLDQDARAACSVLARGGRVDARPIAARAFACAEVVENLAKAPRRPGALAYYTGHGSIPNGSPDPSGGVLLASTDLGALGVSHVLGALSSPHDPPACGTTVSPAGKSAGLWTALLLNSCYSGYVDVRTARGPTTVLGSAYGEVEAVASTRPLGPFADMLVPALAGHADRPPAGNCDGIVTDQEAYEFLVPALAAEGLRSSGGQLFPTAILKRNVDAQLPLAWPGRPESCGLPPLEVAELPEALRSAAIAYRELLSAEVDAVPELGRSFLLFSHDSLSAAELDATSLGNAVQAFEAGLSALSPPQGWTWVGVGAADADRVRRAVGVASFLDVLWLHARRSAFGGVYLDLHRPRDGTVLWGATFQNGVVNAHVQDAARGLVRRLPRRLELVAVTRQGTATSTILRASAGLRHRARAVPFALPLTVAHANGQEVKLGPPAACPAGFGQCFQIHDARFYSKTDQWLLVDHP